ncbi:MAG: glycosyltransferase family 2 protein [Sphingobacteriaceae bacterium]|jgi:glycosyltransferase involved in cell wall biosynthesis
MSVKVSICIPTYNQTEFLKKNLESIIAQTFTDHEIIITDDSTTNEVEELVKQFFKLHPVNYIYHKNNSSLGSPANWNKAISLAKGEYIKILHHDDWFKEKDSLEKFVNALDHYPQSNLAYSATSILNAKDNTYSVNKPDSEYRNSLHADPLVLFNNNRIGAPSATIYRASTDIRFDERISYLVDVDFYLQLLSANSNATFIEEALIVNVSHLDTQVTASSINKKTQIGEYCYMYNKWFKGKFPNTKLRLFFKDLFAWYKLNSFDEIETLGYEKPEPQWIFKLLFFQSKFSKHG